MNNTRYLLFFLIFLSSPGLLAQRLAVPEYVTCNRNQLTSWQGTVERLERAGDEVKIWISTDYGTREFLKLAMPDWQGTLGQFRLRGNTFRDADWGSLFDTAGKIKPGVKAIIWLCNTEGVKPVIDWQPPLE
ncbi:hypothetical protein ACJJIF_19600 [Microbulbifer sp. SSSA002]|uniref:hypothetical protein n=1 Tax=Microbulbifer sp. SSSA002 TaxID=3243376 RepID=UPI0040398CAE